MQSYPEFDEREFNQILQKCRDKSHQEQQDQILLQPYNYIHQIPGKNVRGKLALAFNQWLNIPTEKMHEIGNIVHMLHNSSLLGVPVAHAIYGEACTINAANYAMFIALEKIQMLGHPEATRVYTEQLLELHRGQGMEIFWRDNFHCPTESDYKQMTIRKTGGLFMLAIRLMQLFSTNKTDFTKLTALLGLYFQIRDDYCNLMAEDYADNKSYCEDLTEGKYSFPIIHAIQQEGEDRQVFQILRQRTTNNEVKRYCVSIMEKLGSFSYTRSVLESLDREARIETMRLGNNPIMEGLLNELKTWK
ncbi:terpene synthase isoform X2 [Lutzomyia longipalpis]|uniref:terpene synthase isoform X2 n=1 Tax=Lutzomyia longipalpis TaxID=7200 RepID=UPI002483C14E|nr:terpene synthase isoform X2 [Lutzomyia longipalpis]